MPGAAINYNVELGQARAQAIVAEKARTACARNALGCMEFTGSLNTSGYGQVYTKKNSNMHLTGRGVQTAFLLHTVAYLAKNGTAPMAHCSHLCDNPKCFNDEHLVDESAIHNNARKGCWGDILCPTHGHPIVQFCSHSPKCIRQPMTGEKVMCCKDLEDIALEHSSQPGFSQAFIQQSSSRPSTRDGTQ